MHGSYLKTTKWEMPKEEKTKIGDQDSLFPTSLRSINTNNAIVRIGIIPYFIQQSTLYKHKIWVEFTEKKNYRFFDRSM